AVTTVGSALIHHSLERTRKSVRDRVVSRRSRPTRVLPATARRPMAASHPRQTETAAMTRPGATSRAPAVGESLVWMRPGTRPTVVRSGYAPNSGTRRPADPTARFGHLPSQGQLPVEPREPTSSTAPPRAPRVRNRITLADWRSLKWKKLVLVGAAFALLGIGSVVAVESGIGESLWGDEPSTARAFTGGGVRYRPPEQAQLPERTGRQAESATPATTTQQAPTTAPIPTTQPPPPTTRQPTGTTQPTPGIPPPSGG
ncbi:MAG: hypothetical protein ACRDRN_19920, partial [Sciscionella sp.]